MEKNKPLKLSSNRIDGWFWQFIMVAVVHLFAVQFEAEAIAIVSKSVLIPALGAWYWQHSQRQYLWFYLALAASWVGDILLTQSGVYYFIGGLLAFLLTHLIYAYFFFRSRAAMKHWQVNLILTLWCFLIVYGWYLTPFLAELRLPVYFYMAVITTMASFAIARQRKLGGSRQVWQGALLFMLSDSVLAYGKFIHPLPGQHWWVMISYIAAQFYITWGMLRDESTIQEG